MKIKENKTSLQANWKKYLFFLIVVAVIGIAVSTVTYFKKNQNTRNSSVTIEFAYDGAAKQLTTSGERLSVDEIKNADILTKAIEKAGLSDRYTAEQIRDSVVISGSYPKDVIRELQSYQSLYDFSGSTRVSLDDYHPTRYVVRLYDSFDRNVAKNELTALVNAIADTYKEYFLGKYIYAFDMSAIDSIMVSEDADYANQLEIAALRIDLMSEYVKKMYSLDTSFRFGGKSFNDLSIKCGALKNDLDKIEGIVVTEAVTTSLERTRDRYRYESKVLQTEKKNKTECIEKLDALIERYQTDNVLYIASGNQILKVDSNSKDTYEKLVDKKRELSDRIIEIDTLLGDYTYYLNAYTKETPASKELQTSVADKIQTLNDSIIKLEGDIEDLSSAYNERLTGSDALSVSNLSLNAASVLSLGFIVNCIKVCAPIGIAALVIICLHAFFYEITAAGRARKLGLDN